MASTFTSSNGLEKMSNGDQPNNWGITLDNNFDLIDQSNDGTAGIVLTSTTYNLTITPGQISNGRSRIVNFAGSLASAANIVISPVNISKMYWFLNGTNQPLVVSNGTGFTATVPPGLVMPLYSDGIGNVVSLTANIALGNATLSGNLTLESGTTINGGFTAFVPAITGSNPVITQVGNASYSLFAGHALMQMELTVNYSATPSGFFFISSPLMIPVQSSLSALHQQGINAYPTACFHGTAGNIVVYPPSNVVAGAYELIITGTVKAV